MELKKINIKVFLILLLSLLFKLGNGQDIHFSQFNNSPLNLNPAQTGFFRGSHRFVLNHRNQWASVTVPYKTFSGSFDMQLMKRKLKQDIIGIGIVFNNDIAGDADMGTTSAGLSVSYTKGLNRKNNHFISIGFQGSGAQHKIDYTKLYFDNQYDGDHFDANLYNNENFKRSNFSYLDFSAGVHWFLQTSEQTIFNAGFSAFHINKPVLSFFDDRSVYLNTRYVFYGNILIDVSKNTDLQPSLLLMKQGNYQEITLGSDVKFTLNNNPFFYSAISTGAYLRLNDAIITKVNFEQKRWNLGISYDFNFSDLHPASKYLGGYEVSIIYIINHIYHKKVKEIPCPIF